MTPQELKNSILQLAIQGKLVEQRPEEGTAEELFQQIQEEKAAWIIAGKMKRDKVQQEITTEEIPFDIPDTWKWVRIQDLFNVKSAMRIHQTDWKTSGIPFFRGRELVQLVKTGNVNFDIYISRELYEANKAKGGVPQKDDLLISAVGTLGKVYVVKGTREFYYKDAYILCLENIGKMFPHYVKFALESPYSQAEIRRDSMATTVAQLTIIKAKGLLIPLPPVEEQKRIVAKLEEILPLIDRYETAWNKLEEFNKRFPGDMQKSILQIAMQGKLVPQSEEEIPQRELYKQVQRAYKRSKPLPKIDDVEIPYDIPDSWFWVRLGDALIIERGGSPRPIKEYITNDPNGINWIKIGDTEKGGKYINATQERIIPEGMKKSRYVQKGDFLLSNSMSFGRPYILNIDGCIHDGWLVLRPVLELFDKDYLYYLLSSPMVFAQFCSRVAGAVVNNLNSDKVALTVVPVPPLAEQKRIVVKLEEILPLCERLK